MKNFTTYLAFTSGTSKHPAFFHSGLKASLSCLFLFWCFLFSTQQVKAQQHTADFSSAPAISNPYGDSWPWNTLATLTLGGVEYELSQSGNGSWEHSTTGGKTGGALMYNTAATTYVTLKRKDGKNFNFYGIWLKYENYMDPVYYIPPYLRISYTGATQPEETYEANTTVELSKDVTVSSVTFYFSGLKKLSLDNLIIGPASAPTVVLPSVTTSAPYNFTSISAVLGGNIIADGNAAITEKGIVYSNTNNSPTTTNSTKVTIGSGTGSFAKTVSGLTASTTYYVRAYAINSEGTAYGNVQTFSTAAATTTITAINRVSATPTNASAVSYTVTFAAPVTGVDATDFKLTKTETATGTIDTPTGSGTTWTVPITSVTGNGALRLDFTGTSGVTPNVSTSYTSGQTYTIDKTVPVITGVADNGLYTANRTITFNEGSASLNNNVFTSGSTVSTDGNYTLVVIDAAGNSTTINFILDKTTPVISNVPTQAIVVATPSNSCETAITFPNITLSDNHSSPGDIALKYTIAGNEITTGYLFKVGTTEIKVLATDKAGNLTTAVFTVNLQDKTFPIITPPVAITQANNAGECGATVTLTNPEAEDNCGIASINSDAPTFFPIGITLVKWTVTDIHNNKSEITQQVTIIDTEKPKAIAQDLTIQLSGSGTATINADQVNYNSTDNCGIKEITVKPSYFTCSNIDANTVILIVTDNSGNISSATAIVTVKGSIPTPAITVIPTSTVYTGGNPNIIYLGYGTQSVKLKASGGVKYTWSPITGLSNLNIADPVFTPTSPGTYIFTVTAISSTGCSAAQSVTITVINARPEGSGGKDNQVVVCHKSRRMSVDPTAVQDHLAHGDKLGDCSSTTSPNRISSRNYSVGEELSATNTLKSSPNPFFQNTNLEFVLNQDTEYTLTIYDAAGRFVQQLSAGKAKAGQLLQVKWQANTQPKGLYLVRLTTKQVVQHLKLVKE